MSPQMLGVALALSAAGPVALRLGWQRNRPAVIAGWAGLALAAIMLTRGEGAWGLAAGAACAMVCAMATLAVAGFTTPAPRGAANERVAANAVSSDFPSRTDLARRLGIFVVVVLLDLAASAQLAWSVQRSLYHYGTDAADATAWALFLLPLLWLAMASWQMMQDRLLPMTAPPTGIALLGGLLWLTT